MHSSSNSKRPKTCLHTHSMTGLLLQQELLTTDISQQELSRMWSADMLVRQVTMYLEDSDGIAMAFQLNMRSIRSSISSQRIRSLRWELINTMLTAEESSWDILRSGKLLWIDSQDGLILRKTTKPWISISWNQFGMSSRPSSTKDTYIEAERLCPGPTVAIQFFRILSSNKITSRSLTHLFMSLSLWRMIPMLSLSPGLLPLGHFLLTLHWQLTLSSHMSKSKILRETKFSSLLNADWKISLEKKNTKLLKKSKAKIWKALNTNLSLISSLKDEMMDALESNAPTSLLIQMVPVLFTVLLALERTITKCV